MENQTKFFHAVSSGNLDQTEKCLRKGLSPNFCLRNRKKQCTTFPLLTAIDRNNVKMVTLLTKHGAKIIKTLQNNEIYNILLFVFMNKDVELLRLILTKKPKRWIEFSLVNKLLYYLCRQTEFCSYEEFSEIGRLLMERGADPFGEYNDDGTFPLWVAAEKGNYKAVLLLIDFCKEKKMLCQLLSQYKIDTLSTPLYLACQNGHYSIANLLLKSGTEVNTETSFGMTPLSISAMNGRIELVKLLVKYGVDNINKSLQIANSKDHLEIVDFLSDIVLAKHNARMNNMIFFMHNIDNGTFNVHPRYWLFSFLPGFSTQELFDWIPTKIKKSIEGGYLPDILADLVPYMCAEDRKNFYIWIDTVWTLQQTCKTANFKQIYPDFIASEVSSYLAYPQPTQNLIEYLYTVHIRTMSFETYTMWMLPIWIKRRPSFF